MVEVTVVKGGHEPHHVDLVGAEAAFYAGGDFIEIEIYAHSAGPFGLGKGFE